MDEFQIKAYLVKGLGDIQMKNVFVNDKNYMLIRKRLELERQRAVDIFKDMKEKGQILTVKRPKFKPKNLDYQKKIDELVFAKKIISHSILKIKEMYYI